MSRVADDGGVKVRLNVDPIDRPVTADADISLWVERGAPRFEGSIAFARAVGRAPEGGQALIIEPWRVTSRVKGDSAAAVLEQIEFQYGPDDRAIKLRGDAKLTFGSQPQLVGVLSSPQLDLDRMLALPEATRRRPLVAIKALADNFSGAQRLPFPVRLGLSVETLTLAGASSTRERRPAHRRRDLGHREPGRAGARHHPAAAQRPLRLDRQGRRIHRPGPRRFRAIRARCLPG